MAEGFTLHKLLLSRTIIRTPTNSTQ